MMPWEMMAVKEVLLWCFLGALLVSGVGSLCVPSQCLDCEKTTKVPALNESSEVCDVCANNTCFSVLKLYVMGSHQSYSLTPDATAHLNPSSEYSVNEGDNLILHCCHNLPLVDLFEWLLDGEVLECSNVSKVTLKAFSTDKGAYRCRVRSPCGNFTSEEQQLDVEDGSVLLVVLCGSCAVVLVLGMGASMKYKQKKEQAAQKRRQEERAKALQMTSSMTPRNS
ncbi:uncharacterized protein LOC130390876 [Gadus chalcogrammus]|uniref:uncharacterized protein LOC130390876 n=1 Tax=Gadus chalcogrammus TaxID=1042646 RepID=UPI0024C4D7D7|nr:uncharacterized protein LOC130390876 [Gadus chalcogrammus]